MGSKSFGVGGGNFIGFDHQSLAGFQLLIRNRFSGGTGTRPLEPV